MGATHPLVSATGFCVLRMVDNPIHQKWIFPPLSPPYPLPVPPSSKHLPLEVWYCILYGNTSTLTLWWIQATMDHLPPPHHLTVYSCLHCTPLSYQYGDTPLHAASGNGQVSVAEMLLQRGADVNLADKVTCGGKCQLLIDWVVNHSEHTETSGWDQRMCCASTELCMNCIKFIMLNYMVRWYVSIRKCHFDIFFQNYNLK